MVQDKPPGAGVNGCDPVFAALVKDLFLPSEQLRNAPDGKRVNHEQWTGDKEISDQ